MEKKNKLIAEFMGVAKHYEAQSSNMFNQYHTDWNRLMPVVQKIEQDCEGVPQEMLNISLYSDINEVYKAVVEFIKDYNQNN
jgi:hypothetical protein